MGFDPVQFKKTTREQWETAAEAWHRWGPAIEEWLGAATERMLDAAGVKAGSSVLDVAAGAGGQTLAAARRVGPDGRVVATDISPTILTYAAKQAADEGLTNVETLEVDAERVGELAGTGFDAAISRVGIIYVPDQIGTLRSIHSALRPGGKVATVEYTTPDRNGFFAGPVGIIRGRAGLPAPGPGLPGPFSLGGPGVVEAALTEAGFVDITVDVLEAPVRMASAEECLRFEKESFGALHQMLSGVPEDERQGVWDEVLDVLRKYETPSGFVGPCELHVASATRP